ncbi:hypothetical protein D5086_016850 [Populus alba]|uniref:Uncharacterized protein n=1 Tax=Populus alba TaxID=43335 RepID=A0ACC4BV42_POPAL
MGFVREVFEEMEDRDTVCKNSMVLGYGNSERVYVGQHIYHGWMEERNVICLNSLIQGYVKAGDIEEAFVLR